MPKKNRAFPRKEITSQFEPDRQTSWLKVLDLSICLLSLTNALNSSIYKGDSVSVKYYQEYDFSLSITSYPEQSFTFPRIIDLNIYIYNYQININKYILS